MPGILSKLKRWALVSLDGESDLGELTDEHHATLHALLQTVADDESFSAEACRNYVCRRTHENRGLRNAYIAACKFLDGKSGGTGAFAGKTLLERDAVLRKLLRTYPARVNNAKWRKRFGLTAGNVDLLLTSKDIGSLRQFVIQDLLTLYYSSDAGWSVVGYPQYPGKATGEDDPTRVEQIDPGEEGVRLLLSDGTYEWLTAAMMRAGSSTLAVKNGRQEATVNQDQEKQLRSLLAQL